MPRIRSRHGRRRGAASILAASLTVIPLGCGDSRTEPPPPFEMGKPTIVTEGDPAKQRKAPFAIAITSPTKGEVFKQGSRVEVTCALTVAPGGAIPWLIDLNVIDRKNRIVDSGRFVPESDLGGGRYTLVAAARLPKQPGVYRLEAMAIDSVKFASADDDDSSKRGIVTESLEVKAQ